MIIETDEYRQLLKTELAIFAMADNLARMNKRYAVKCGVLVVKGSQIICGNLANFRASRYHDEWMFHPEATILDMYDSEVDQISYFISRLNMQDEPVKSRPCVKCMREIEASGEILTIFYRDENLRIVKEVIR